MHSSMSMGTTTNANVCQCNKVKAGVTTIAIFLLIVGTSKPGLPQVTPSLPYD